MNESQSTVSWFILAEFSPDIASSSGILTDTFVDQTVVVGAMCLGHWAVDVNKHYGRLNIVI